MGTDVFISYAREDRVRVQPLAQALDAAGFTVWWDRDILAGQSFDHAIEKALDAAGCVVVCWSRHSVGSEWVRSEAAAGAERGALVPVMLDDVRLPLEFRRKQTVSLIGWDGGAGAEAFADLVAGIRAAIKQPQPARVATENAAAVRPVPPVPPKPRRRLLLTAVSAVPLIAAAAWLYLTPRAPQPAANAARHPVTARILSGGVAISKAVFSPRGYLIAMRHGVPDQARSDVEWDEGGSRHRGVAEVLKKGVLSSEIVLLQLKDRPLAAMPFSVRIASTLKPGDRIERFISEHDRAPGEVKAVFASMSIHGNEAKPVKLDRLLRTTQISGPGDSGAPVIDAQGRVVGLIYGASESETVSLMIEDVKASFPEAF